jgi:hypothetical protein
VTDPKPVTSDVSEYRAPVDVKYQVRLAGLSWWSRKTLGGMELVVSRHTIEVRLRSRTAGRLLGNTWVFDPSQTRVEVSREPAPRLLSRPWIVLSSGRDGKAQAVGLAASGAMEDIWGALVASGATADSAPPEPG